MIDWVVKKWDKNKSRLEKYLKTHKQEEYDTYENLLRLIIKNVLNYGELEEGQEEKIRIYDDCDNDIVKIDFGDYQGTLIYVFAYDTYQPYIDETFYTSVHYGSCSGCDTLKGIHGYMEECLPNKNQLQEYMQLCLHLIQNIKQFKENK